MRLMDISLNNLKRRKNKMFFLSLGLVIGVATVVSLISMTQAMQADIQKKLDSFGANIVITPKSDEASLSYGGVFVASTAVNTKDMKMGDIQKIAELAAKYSITNIAPKLVGRVQIGDSKALLVGVDFEDELKMKKWWEITGREPSAPDEVLLGAVAAKKLASMPGSKLKVGATDLTVAGVLRETGTQEDSVIFAGLSETQQILGKPDAITFVEVSVPSSMLDATAEEIRRALPEAKVSALSDALESTRQRVSQLTSFSLAVSIVVLVVGILVVLVTMMSSVSERTREIGIFRATGFRKSHILFVILFEAFVVSVGGGISGWAIGSLVTFVIGPRIAQISSGITPSPVLGLVAVLLSVLIGIAGALYPAVHASNLDPSEALRFT